MAHFRPPVNISDFENEDFTFAQPRENLQATISQPGVIEQQPGLGIQFSAPVAELSGATLPRPSNLPPPASVPFPTGSQFPFEFQGDNLKPVKLPPPLPPYTSTSHATFRSERILPDIANIGVTEEEVREALHAFVNRNCCFGPADNVHIHDIQMKNAYKYTLLSFYEQREIVWKTEPWTNQQTDFDIQQQALQYQVSDWDVICHPGRPFAPGKCKVKVPNTSSRKQCVNCIGNGRVRCQTCEGFGNWPCSWCNGSGVRNAHRHRHRHRHVRPHRHVRETCNDCNGSGRRRCNGCDGNGQRRCDDCKGHGQIYVYKQLIVSWKIEKDQFINNAATAIPNKKLARVTSVNVLQEQRPVVYPLESFPDNDIKRTSTELIRKQFDKLSSTGRILEQKQIVDIIRIGEITFSWKQRNGPTAQFYVYGNRNEVYFPNYPDTCACCTIS